MNEPLLGVNWRCQAGLPEGHEEKDVGGGEIRWDGKRLTCAPSHDRLLWSILRDPIIAGIDGGVDPKQEPEKFIRNLYRHYKSAYLRATKATEI